MAKQDLSELLSSLGSTKTDITGVALDGGLNLKTEAQRLPPPAVTRADNAWHVQPGNVQQLPPFYSAFTDDPAPLAPYHVYNLSTRDLSPPAPLGDLLVHAEYNDTGYTTDTGNVPVTGFTRPLWAYNSARTRSYEQACLPFALRVRPLSAPLAVSSTASARNPTVYGNQLLFAREEGVVPRRRFVMGAIQNFVFQATAGYVDGLSRTTTFSYGTSLVAADLLGVQGSSPAQAALLAVGSSTSTLYTLNFAGTQTGSVTIPTVANYNAPNAQLFNHAGRTYCAYTGAAANTAVTFRDVLAATAQQVTSSTTQVAINLAVSSPYTHQSQTAVSYVAMVYNGSVYVLSLSGGSWTIVGGPVALPTPATAVSTGTYNYAATVQAMVADSQGGVGASAKLVIAVFSHFPEVAANPGFAPSGSPGYQSVLCTKFAFTAAATSPAATPGTLSLLQSSVFRTPAGAGLVSKAFCTNPPEAAYAGPTAARHAVACVQSGAVEPDSTQAYNVTASDTYPYADRDSQPTYFLVDHNADIVGRFLEGAAATRPANFAFSFSGSAQTVSAPFPGVQSLANPLFSDGTGDDQSLLNITVPVWGALNPRFGGVQSKPSTQSSLLYQTRRFASYTYIPQAATLSYNTSAPPAANVGAHTYISGACPMVHDGNGLVEQNYHFGAPNLVVNSAGYTGAQYGYHYYLVYCWYDAQGRLHRSKPSYATTVTSSSATAGPSVTYYVPLMPGNKGLVGQAVFAEVYSSISENTDGNAYLLETIYLPALSKSTAQPTMFVPLAPGSQATLRGTIQAQPAIYTTPNAVAPYYTYEANPPRASYWQVAAKGRCFSLVQVAGQQRIYYSSVANDIYPFEWNALNYAMVPPDIGDARSLEVIDDKVVVLGTRGNAVMTGDGPAGGGTTVPTPVPNDGFSPVTPIPVPAGVLGSGAPARIPDGIIYQGYSGIQLIGRDLGITAAGANVDVLTGRQVGNPGVIYGKGVTLPTLQSVVWPNPRGAALVYSYLTAKWSTWPLLPNAAVLAQKMDGSVWAALQPIVGTQLSPYAVGAVGADVGYLGTSYAPMAGASVSPGLVLETPWVLLAGSSTGEADLWDMALVGTWQGPHILRVEQAYNYGAYALTQTLDMTAQPLTYQSRWRPLQNSRVWAVRYRVSLLPVTTLQAGYAMAELADLVVYSTNNAGSTRVGQGATR